jgi:hypothetical protein
MTISVKNILTGILITAVIIIALLFSLRLFHQPGKTSKGAQSTRLNPTLNSDTVPIGFYNVENLFDLNDDGGEYPEYRPGALGWNQQTFDKKIANISSAIVALRVDIIGLCEIENRNALQALRSALAKRGDDFPYFAIADFPGIGSTCPSLLSKYPIVHFRDIRAPGEGKGGRSILEADIDCGTALKVFVNHWPSKAHPESERLAMARALAERIASLPAHCDYVVMGDLNTDYDEWSRFHSAGLDDTKGVVGLDHVLKTVNGGPGKFLSYVTKKELCRNDTPGMHYDPWIDVPGPVRFTRKYHAELETPDHFLLPASLFDGTGFSYCDSSFKPFSWNDTLLRNGEPFRWQLKGFGKRRFHVGEGYSDHLPVRISLVKKPWVCDTTTEQRSSNDGSTGNNGFEMSTEGWTGCSSEIAVVRDSVSPFAGRYCLRLEGVAGKNNLCAAHTVLHRETEAPSRSITISFAIRGKGKLSIRVRSRNARSEVRVNAHPCAWQYYKGESFALCNSSRFLPVQFPVWKQVALAYTSGSAGTQDVDVEIRAGKEGPFCFYLDEVKVQ